MAADIISMGLAIWQALCLGIGAAMLTIALITIGAKVLRIWL